MGLNIDLRKSDGSKVEEWDWFRHAGDREFCSLTGTLPIKRFLEEGTYNVWMDPPEIFWWRPENFEVWRSKAETLPNPKRFEDLLRLLEQDPDIWVDPSY